MLSGSLSVEDSLLYDNATTGTAPGSEHVPPLSSGNLVGVVPSSLCTAEDQLGVTRSSPCEVGAIEIP